jgi:hypothetical protein
MREISKGQDKKQNRKNRTEMKQTNKQTNATMAVGRNMDPVNGCSVFSLLVLDFRMQADQDQSRSSQQ